MDDSGDKKHGSAASSHIGLTPPLSRTPIVHGTTPSHTHWKADQSPSYPPSVH